MAKVREKAVKQNRDERSGMKGIGMKLFRKKKVKGAVSIFLVIILLPVMLLSAVLIDGSRMASAVAMTQEAADLAAASALASYNQDLKDDFGLFAIKDNSKLESIYKESLAATLMASGLSDDEGYSEQIWEILKSYAGMENPYKGKSFLNLYDFSVDKCDVTPLYSLANKDVLESQMVEYAKFRGLYVMADRFNLLGELESLKKEAEEQEKASEVMEDKMSVDEANGRADKELAKLRDCIEELNCTVADIFEHKEPEYIEALKAEMEVIRVNHIDTEESLSRDIIQKSGEYGQSRKQLQEELKNANSQAKGVKNSAISAKRELDRAIDRLRRFQQENKDNDSNDVIKQLVEDAKRDQDIYQQCMEKIETLLAEPILNKLANDNQLTSDVGDLLEDINEAIHLYEEELVEMEAEDEEEMDEEGEGGGGEEEDEEITEYYFYYLNLTDSSTDVDEVVEGGSNKCYRNAVNKEIEYFKGKQWEGIIPAYSGEGQNAPDEAKKKLTEDFAKEQSQKNGSTEDGQNPESSRGEVDQGVYDARPSKTFDAAAEANSYGEQVSGDIQNLVEEVQQNQAQDFYNREGDLSVSRDILKNGRHSMISDMGEMARDDILCLSYLFGTFKTRLTGVSKFSKEKMPQSEQDSFYMPKWRYVHEGGEVDMRFSPKKERKTVLRSEIEYLIYGNRTDQANEDAVYATIYGERLANNLLALYLEKNVVNPTCHAAAAAASAATLGVVPEIVFFWIFLTAWAVAETYLEMNFLISDGYRVPLIKTNKNVLLKEIPEPDEGLVSNYGEDGAFVTYEDYLLILLVIKGEQKRIMRSADLIEMNMKLKQNDFAMSQAFTYLRAQSDMSIRYLFGSVQPFQGDYERNGVTGRMKFKNTIYQGY